MSCHICSTCQLCCSARALWGTQANNPERYDYNRLSLWGENPRARSWELENRLPKSRVHTSKPHCPTRWQCWILNTLRETRIEPTSSRTLCWVYFFPLFFGSHLQYMEVPRLGVKSELQLPAYTTATATSDPSCVCNIHHSSQQHRNLKPLREARDRTYILVAAIQFHFCWATMETPEEILIEQLFSICMSQIVNKRTNIF